MRISQVSNNYQQPKNSPYFGAFITKRFLDGVMINDLTSRISNAVNSDEKEKMMRLVSVAFKKAKEIYSWDNFHTQVDIVPHSGTYKINDVYDLVISSFRGENGKPLDGIGYSVIVKTFDSANQGIADVFVNFSKKAYQRAKRGIIVAEAQKAFQGNADSKELDAIQQRIGKDSFEVFKHEFFRLKKRQQYQSAEPKPLNIN